jgi:hypothetical protein
MSILIADSSGKIACDPNDSKVDTTGIRYKVGDWWPRYTPGNLPVGVVFYVKNDGFNGLVSRKGIGQPSGVPYPMTPINNRESVCLWGCNGTSITGQGIRILYNFCEFSEKYPARVAFIVPSKTFKNATTIKYRIDKEIPIDLSNHEYHIDGFRPKFDGCDGCTYLILSKKGVDRCKFYKDFLPKHTGEFYLTESINGIAKGGHYHNKANEWFTLIYGKCTLCLCDIITKEVIYLELLSSHPQTIYVPNKIAHVFYNKSNCEFGLVAYSDELYDPLDTIIYDFMELLK